jgi:hypothetical protein
MDAASVILETEDIMGISAPHSPFPKGREMKSERVKFSFRGMIILSYKFIFGLFFLLPFLYSLILSVRGIV